MAIAVAFILLVVIMALVYYFSRNKSKKWKVIAWGITTMLAITPLLSWLISITVAIIVQDGWAAVGLMMILLPLFFVIGLIILLVGIFKKFEIA
ncbi:MULTISPECIES: hypothetical protein [Lysinibacillus]|uniref:Dehalogenase n=1 Tax=Lysinibacillus antri TaxID=2498145 RepID=A0A432L987_9BACI|nr:MULTISPECIES: hypothetical protein [Lysinibacillus]RUL49882.1 hypothetical protein EK386_14500 [Lysinibacillus antri]TSI05079.1 hypothetical protein FJQ64_12230 [Lysinibacillus sp. BW-2-10]